MAVLLVMSSIIASVMGVLLALSPRVYAHEFMMESGVSSAHQIPYSVSDGIRCFKCNFFADDISVKTSRKLLREEREEEYTKLKDGDYPHHRAKQDGKSLATSQTIGMVVTGTFVLCFGVLCPCFYRKRRRTVQRGIEIEQPSGESLVLYEFLAVYEDRSIVS